MLEHSDRYDEDADALVPTWRCRNCGRHTPRRVRPRRAGRTPSQEQALADLRAHLIPMQVGERAHYYEFKQWRVEDLPGGRVMLQYSFGRIGDEGTMAQTFARHRAIITIGRNGGLKCLAYRGRKRLQARGRAVYWTYGD